MSTVSQEALNSAMEQIAGFQLEADSITWGDDDMGLVGVFVNEITGCYVVSNSGVQRSFKDPQEAAAYAAALIEH